MSYFVRKIKDKAMPALSFRLLRCFAEVCLGNVDQSVQSKITATVFQVRADHSNDLSSERFHFSVLSEDADGS